MKMFHVSQQLGYISVMLFCFCCPFALSNVSRGSKSPVESVQSVNSTINVGRATDSGTNDIKKDRAALFSQPRIFPFLEQLFNPAIPALTRPLSPSVHRPFPTGGGSIGHYGGDSFYSTTPECALNGLYCLYNTAYPSDKVNLIVDRFYDDVRDLYSSLHRVPVKDLLYYDNKTHSYRDNGHFVCESQVQYIRPGWARSIRGQWLTIINTPSFPQTVRVEECKYADRRCEYLPPCYKSTCVQRFSFDKLLSVDPLDISKKPFIEVFEIPTACSCFVENFVLY